MARKTIKGMQEKLDNCEEKVEKLEDIIEELIPKPICDYCDEEIREGEHAIEVGTLVSGGTSDWICEKCAVGWLENQCPTTQVDRDFLIDNRERLKED